MVYFRNRSPVFAERVRVAEALIKGLLMDLDEGAEVGKNGTLSGTRRHHHQVVMQAIAMIQDRQGTLHGQRTCRRSQL